MGSISKRRTDLYEIVKAIKPMTVRQVFYKATVRSLLEKVECSYDKVQTALADMRKAGKLPFLWISDDTRWLRKPMTFNGVEEALYDTAKIYRKSLWSGANSYVEIWLEKDALAGVIYQITDIYDVPLMVARGYASLSFLFSAAEEIKRRNLPAHIYHLGDYDPSGVNAGEKIEQTLREMAPNAEIHFQRLAVTPVQIIEWNLPTRPTKKTNSRAKKFGEISVELDSIEPNMLRGLVENAILQHLPADEFKVLKAAEESERDLIACLVDDMRQVMGEYDGY